MTIKYALQIVSHRPGAEWMNGKFIKDFDFEYDHGRGGAVLVDTAEEAKHFDGFIEAMDFWKTTSVSYPIRWDGQPNRPLTATSVIPTEVEVNDGT